MIFFLYGPNSYLRLNKTNHLISKYQTKHLGLSFKNFDLTENPEESLADLKNFCSSQSLFENIKLALVKNPFFISKTKDFKNLIQNIATSSTVNLILVSDTKPNKSFSFLLKKPIQFEEFPAPSLSSLKKIISDHATSISLKLSSEEINRLSSESKDSWEAINKVNQISLLSPKNRPLLLTSSKKYEFFSLIKYLSSPHLGQRLAALKILKKDNPDPAQIFNFLAYQVKINRPLVASIDLDIKSGRLDYEEGLLKIILSF